VTVVAQPAYEIGRLAGTLLLERIRGTGPDAARHEILRTSLVERDSSRRGS
jgi:DNA-binding LacI/PurR family transcriptional regulator